MVLVFRIAFVNGEAYEFAAAANIGICHVIVCGFIGAYEGATRALKTIEDLSQCTAECVGIRIAVAATEEAHTFARKVKCGKCVEEVVPVVLEVAAAPGGGTEKDGVVVFYFRCVSCAYVVNVGSINAQHLSYFLGYAFCVARGATEKDTCCHKFNVSL